MSKEQTDRFLELMSFASAPFNPTSILMDLDDLEAEDLTPAVFLEELEFVERFAGRGFHAFAKTLKHSLEEQKRRSEADNGESGSCDEKDIDQLLPPTGKYADRANVALNVTAYLLPFYLKRLSRLSDAIERVADVCRKHYFGDMTPEVADELRRLIQLIDKGTRPKQSGNLQDVCDLTRGLKWDVPDLKMQPSTGKVGFKETATELLNGERLEAPLKLGSNSSKGSTPGAAAYGRRKGRNPTGFAKFNFAELQALEDEAGLETPTSERSSVKIESGPPSILRRESSDFSRESFKVQRQHSSIDDSKTVEISDDVSDPKWHDQKRKESREVRVRRRIPTGHPNMMKSALVARASLEFEEDEETKTNTEMNERVV